VSDEIQSVYIDLSRCSRTIPASFSDSPSQGGSDKGVSTSGADRNEEVRDDVLVDPVSSSRVLWGSGGGSRSSCSQRLLGRPAGPQAALSL